MLTNKACNGDIIHPLGMMFASSLNLCGALTSLIVSSKDRGNPFYYTAMATSAIYIASNAVKVAQVYQKNKQSFVDAELARREENSKLTEIIIQK